MNKEKPKKSAMAHAGFTPAERIKWQIRDLMKTGLAHGYPRQVEFGADLPRAAAAAAAAAGKFQRRLLRAGRAE
jgi:acyl-coenzyme A synthetase/AMP-(fatty) acid ligase